MMPDRYMPDVIAPKILYDFIRAIKAPGRARRGEVLDEEEALNTALNMFGGGLATSGSVPIGALGMSARTAPAGTVPLREIPRSPLGFYSKVEEATAQIQKTPGVKPEEIEVLGLDKFLQSKPTVTKQEVQDYITANKPDVQEVRLGGATSPYPYRTADEWQGAINRAEARGNWDEAANLNQAWEMAEGFGGAGAPKFSQYTIPGGENYRELLLTLPRKNAPEIEYQVYGAFPSTKPFASRAEAEEYILGINEIGQTKDGIARALANSPLRIEEMQTQASRSQEFRSTHYDQPNILTHLRANDRVIDGKKALFIEEIQSDWHQAGRKKGYGPQTETEAYYITPDGSRVSLGFGKTQEEAAAAVDPGWKNLVDIKFDTQTKKFGEGVPDAPFKKSWHELALKRAIQEAVDKGYDKLAFTTGKTQAERYDLSKQVDKVAITKTGGVWAVNAWKGGSKAITKDVSTDADLANLVGKELAEKAIKQGGGEYAGLDLQVGGEGQKGFYDEILPKALQNLTKKYGTKVTKSKLDEGSEVWSMDITPQMREQIKSKGQPLFATAPPLGLASQDPLEQFLGYQEAENDPMMQFLGQK